MSEREPSTDGGTATPTAIVTGASAGIGWHLARLLAADGYGLVLVARRRERLERLAEELAAEFGAEARVVARDLSRPAAAEALLEELGPDAARVEVLVNNAGFGTLGPFAETPLAHTDAMLELNVGALIRLTRLLLPFMLERGRGRILNVASTAGFQPGPLMSAYYASKAYVLNFSIGLGEELRGTGVSVTCLCPGPTRTEFQQVAEIEDSRLMTFQPVMGAEAVARAGHRGLMRGRSLVVPGLWNRLVQLNSRLWPRSWNARLVKAIHAPRR